MKNISYWIGGSVVGLIILANLFGGAETPAAATISSPQSTTPAVQAQPAPVVTPVPTPVPKPQPKPTCPTGYYINSYDNCVQSPVKASSVPAGATAKCKDGTYSFSQHRSGTCSHHGGVAIWY